MIRIEWIKNATTGYTDYPNWLRPKLASFLFRFFNKDHKILSINRIDKILYEVNFYHQESGLPGKIRLYGFNQYEVMQQFLKAHPILTITFIKKIDKIDKVD